MSNVVKYWNLGSISYSASNKIQNYLSKLHSFNDAKVSLEDYKKMDPVEQQKNVKNILLAMEHKHVFTTGLRECISPSEEKRLLSTGAEVHRLNRGGLATYHGPGQLTAFPIINLRHFKSSVNWYVNHLEELAIQSIGKYDIKGETNPYTGVWVGKNKICAIGVHISRGVTTHGLAINCCTDLKWFDLIEPCGIDKKEYGVTSLSIELKRKMEVEEFTQIFKKTFEQVFDSVLVDMSDKEKEDVLNNIER